MHDTRGFADTLLAAANELGGGVRSQLPWTSFKEALQTDLQALQTQPSGSVRGPADRFWTTALQQGGWWSEGQTAPPPSGQTVSLGARRAPQFDGGEQQFPYHLVVFQHNTLGAGEAAHLPWMQQTPDPITSVTWQTWVEVNPRVAEQQALREGDIVAVISQHGRVEVPVYVHPAAAPGVLAMPLGQGHIAGGRYSERRGVNPMALLAPVADETSGALAYGATRVRMEKTGRRVSLPKFEGNVPAFLTKDHTIIQVTRGA
jgi:menaquinone reductase, molybdopterin-binding-like subunit